MVSPRVYFGDIYLATVEAINVDVMGDVIWSSSTKYTYDLEAMYADVDIDVKDINTDFIIENLDTLFRRKIHGEVIRGFPGYCGQQHSCLKLVWQNVPWMFPRYVMGGELIFDYAFCGTEIDPDNHDNYLGFLCGKSRKGYLARLTILP